MEKTKNKTTKPKKKKPKATKISYELWSQKILALN